jgi:MFS transporter, FHS family, glucose/mannose:H+ symporter
LGVFFGLGAIGVPLLLAALEKTLSQSTVLLLLGIASIMAVILTLVTKFPTPKQEHGFPAGQALKLIAQPALLILGMMLFLQSGMEMTLGGWTSTFAKEELDLTGRAALYFLSLYWLGMMVARFYLGTKLKTRSPLRALAASFAMAFVGVWLLILSSATLPAAVGVFLVGAGFAGVFPIVLGWVGERYAALSGTAFSISLVMALTGGMILPYSTGIIGDRFGMRASLLIVPVALMISGSLLFIAAKKDIAR